MIYRCNPCRQVFTSAHALERHREHSETHLQMKWEREQRAAPLLLPAHSVPCGLCNKPFEEGRPITLARHLNSHHAEFTGRHPCHECDIYFVHKRDLDAHHRWAAQGSCGMKFPHNRPCRGHHPPGGGRGRGLDRSNFCQALRTWEKTQLESFKKSVAALMKARKDAEDEARKQKEAEEMHRRREVERQHALHKAWMFANFVNHYQRQGYSREQIAAFMRARLAARPVA